jgi:hypothetical protein
VQFKKLCVHNYGTRTVSLALEIYDSDWKSSLSSFDIRKMSKRGEERDIAYRPAYLPIIETFFSSKETALRHVPQGMSKLDKIGFPILF